MKKVDKSSSAGTTAEQSTNVDVHSVSQPIAKPNVMRRFFRRVINAFKIGWWAYRNPRTIDTTNFKMLSDLLALIMKVAIEDRHMMTHLAYIHPTEGEQQIVSIWAGAGVGANPVKRIKELIEENSKLKILLESKVSVGNGA